MVRRRFFIQWDSTNDCNLRCIHCYHNREGRDHAAHTQTQEVMMTLPEVKSMIDDLAQTANRWDFMPEFNISGGEPLMRKDLMEILDYTQHLGIETKLLTNGTLITREKAKEIYGRGVKRLQISLDGNRATHNFIRRREFAYDRALDGIVNSSSEGILVNVSMTVMNSNKDQLEDVVKNSAEAGAKIVGFQSYVPSLELGTRDPEFVDSLTTYNVFQQIRALRKKYSEKIKVLETEVLWQIMQWDTKLKQEARETGKFLSGCGAGFAGIAVLSDGIVYPCRRLPIPIGKISEGIASIMIDNQVLQNLRDFNKLKQNGCCEDVYYCRGCRAIAYATTGDYMTKDPMCFKQYVKSKEREPRVIRR